MKESIFKNRKSVYLVCLVLFSCAAAVFNAQADDRWLGGLRDWFRPRTGKPNLSVTIKKARGQGYEVDLECIMEVEGLGIAFYYSYRFPTTETLNHPG